MYVSEAGAARPVARQGRNAELAVEALQRVLRDSPELVIESPGFLKDIVTGRKREFDVLVTVDGAYETCEVRDRSSVVTVGEIDAFVTKVRDTGVNAAAFVSTRGFGDPAVTKAQHYGVDCLVMRVSDTDQWGQRPEMNVRMAKPTPGSPTTIRFFVGTGAERREVPHARVHDVNHRPPDPVSIHNSALAAINEDRGRKLPRSGQAEVTVPLAAEGLIYSPEEGGPPTVVSVMKVDVMVDILAEPLTPVVFSLHAAESPDRPPVAELLAYPKIAQFLGFESGSLAIGSRRGGPIKMLVKRDQEDKAP